MVKILFVGDLRHANNFGAIATTEMLQSMLVKHLPNAMIKYITYESFYKPTPSDGWSNGGYLKKIIPLSLKKIIKKCSFVKKMIDEQIFVPYRLSLYESYYTKMLNGEIFQYEKKLIQWADVVYINGEGNIVNGTDKYGKYRRGGLYILFIAWLAKVKFSKKTVIVNHTVDPENNDVYQIIQALYPMLDKVFVRETLSVEKLYEKNVSNVSFAPDALFSFNPPQVWNPGKKLKKQIDFSEPYICIGDSSGIKNNYSCVNWDIVKVYTEIILKLKKIIPQVIFIDGFNTDNHDINSVIKKTKVGFINLKNCTYSDLFFVLKNAEVFISGRWHASILSVLAHTPILLWGADSHKTKSLYTLLDYKYNFFDIKTLPIHIDDIVSEVQKIINEKEKIKYEFNKKLPELFQRSFENVKFLSENNFLD